MSVNELFYQSSLINALIFLWVASAISTVRIMTRADKKITTAVSCGLLGGPFALVVSWVLEGASSKKRKLNTERASIFLQWPSFLGIALVSLATIAAFYLIFVSNVGSVDKSNESLLLQIATLLLVAGIAGGITLAALVQRVAFFESSWCACIFASFLVFMDDWAGSIFAYGTSSAYFIVIIACATTLYLIFLTFGGSLGYLYFGEGRLNLRFSYERFIGTRFLMAKRGSQVISLITFISIFAVLIACSGMIVVMSVMNGFSSDLRAKILGANAHLMVLKYGHDFSEYDDIINKTKEIKGITAIHPFVLNEGMISAKNNLSGAIVTGIDVQREISSGSGRLTKYVSKQSIDNLADPSKIQVTIEGSLFQVMDEKNPSNVVNDLPGVIIGKVMASDLHVFVGDVVNIISPVGEMGPTGPIPKARAFRVAGLFNSGMYEYDAKFAYIRLSDAQDFFNLKGSVSGVEYRVDDIENTRAIAKQIDAAIGGYPFYSRDWMQMNRNMFSALQLEKIAMLIILGTLIFMASLLILVTLVMVVMEKGKEIAILKSMGATDASIMKIFVTYGLFVGGTGAIFGGAVGYLMCLVIEKVGIRLDPDVYYFSNLPVKIVPSEAIMVVASAILISFLATIPPALFAARLKPVDGLRYE